MSTANLPNTTALTEAIQSAVRPGFIGRIGTWLKRSPDLARALWRSNAEPADLCSHAESLPLTGSVYENQIERRESRVRFFRGPSQREAITALQDGVSALSQLMQAIHGSLETQSRRQEEIVRCLTGLPELIRHLPESERSQLEALTALRTQLELQQAQQGQLAQVLERVGHADRERGAALETLCRHEADISQSLGKFGVEMRSVGASAVASAQVLEQLRDNIENRDRDMEQAFKSQTGRLNVLLTVAISTSVVALGSVAVMGMLILRHL